MKLFWFALFLVKGKVRSKKSTGFDAEINSVEIILR